jgi:hypothetical protein
MTEPNRFTFDEGEFLTLRIGGTPARPARLLLIGRPREGLVRVREWTSNSWNSEGEDFDIAPGELLAQLEDAHAARLGLGEEMHLVRRWLGG